MDKILLGVGGCGPSVPKALPMKRPLLCPDLGLGKVVLVPWGCYDGGAHPHPGPNSAKALPHTGGLEASREAPAGLTQVWMDQGWEGDSPRPG